MENSRYIRDDRSESFELLGDMSAAIAKSSGGIDVDSTTLHRWRGSMGLLREFDTLVDDGEVSAEESLDLLRDFDYFKDRYPSLNRDNLSDEARGLMVARVAYILALGDGISTTKSVDDFMYYRTEEANHSALLLSDSATEYVRGQDGFEDRFIPTMQTLARTANYLDSIFDYRQDVADGKVEIEASAELFTRLGRGAIRGFMVATPRLMRPKVLKGFADMSIMRARNRIIHGSTPYSSANNIKPVASRD